MNVYTYNGRGHYLNSEAVVIAVDTQQAIDMINKQLVSRGLTPILIDEIKEIIPITPQIVLFNDGDY